MPDDTKKSDIAATARKRYKYVTDSWRKQRTREREDLRFASGGENQWTDQAKRERRGNMVGDVPTPARPMVTINKLNQPRQLIRNQFRQAKLSVNIHPKSPKATPETAQAIQGIYRSIEQESNANDARGWAFNRAVDCGLGFYRVITDYDNEGGRPFDQVIRIERILHQDAVYFDPSASKTDFSDAEFAFVTAWLPVERFKALYPNAKIPDPQIDTFGWEQMMELTPDWVRNDGEIKAVLVCEYWYKKHEKQTMVALPNGETAIEEELAEGEVPEDAPRRPHDATHVFFCKLAPGGDDESGLQHLEGPEEWNGQYIPIIPVLGEELQPYDAERNWQGLVRPNTDAQRAFNFFFSAMLERAAIESRIPYLLDPVQVEGYESVWQQLATRNAPYLPFKRFIGAQDYGVPQRAEVDMSGASLAVLGAQQSEQAIQSGTFAYDPSLGQAQPQRSGKAIIAEQQQFESSSSGYLYNLADVSMNYEARVILDLIPKIYDTPGRIARTLDEEGQSEQIMVNAPFYNDEESGQPLPPGPQMPPDAEVKEYNLTEGVYAVTVTVGKGFQSTRQEGSEVIGELLQARPELLPVLGPLWAKFQDFPGSQDFMKLLLKLRAQQMPFLEDQGSPEQAAAENAVLKQQMQQMQQQMQMMGQALETKQVEQQATMQKAQLDSSTKIETTRMTNETQLQISALRAELDHVKAALQAGNDQANIKAKAHADIATEAAKALLTPPDLNYKGAADMPLPSDKGF